MEAPGESVRPIVHARRRRPTAGSWDFGRSCAGSSSAGRHAVRAVRAVDTATHPDHQGRGIFSTLTPTRSRRCGSRADLVFNTPNEKSLPGYLKMGWQIVGQACRSGFGSGSGGRSGSFAASVRCTKRSTCRSRSHRSQRQPLPRCSPVRARSLNCCFGPPPRIADSPRRETSRTCDGATEPRRSSTTAPSRSRRTAASTGWRSSGSGLVAVCGSPRSPRCSLPRETLGPPRSSSPASATPARSTI